MSLRAGNLLCLYSVTSSLAFSQWSSSIISLCVSAWYSFPWSQDTLLSFSLQLSNLGSVKAHSYFLLVYNWATLGLSKLTLELSSCIFSHHRFPEAKVPYLLTSHLMNNGSRQNLHCQDTLASPKMHGTCCNSSFFIMYPHKMKRSQYTVHPTTVLAAAYRPDVFHPLRRRYIRYCIPDSRTLIRIALARRPRVHNLNLRTYVHLYWSLLHVHFDLFHTYNTTSLNPYGFATCGYLTFYARTT